MGDTAVFLSFENLKQCILTIPTLMSPSNPAQIHLSPCPPAFLSCHTSFKSEEGGQEWMSTGCNGIYEGAKMKLVTLYGNLQIDSIKVRE